MDRINRHLNFETEVADPIADAEDAEIWAKIAEAEWDAVERAARRPTRGQRARYPPNPRN